MNLCFEAYFLWFIASLLDVKSFIFSCMKVGGNNTLLYLTIQLESLISAKNVAVMNEEKTGLSG